MLIPLIKKNERVSGFECRDGEIEWLVRCDGAEGSATPGNGDMPLQGGGTQGICAPYPSLTPTSTYPTVNIRIPLEKGDAEKVASLLGGEVSRVDAESADRLTRAMLTKGAEALLQTSTDLRRRGQFLLPFRFHTAVQYADGTVTRPTPQALALPADFAPHPEITAYSVTDDTLTLALRFPVKPHRLVAELPSGLPSGSQLRIFISYPLYIPDPKEIRGSIGSVCSATGGNVTGLRFSFLSESALKASVSAPEKYYEMVGNERTGYRISSKAADTPDYSCYADVDGSLPPFPAESLLTTGEGAGEDIDPMDWIADWQEAGDGYLPRFLPRTYAQAAAGDDAPEVVQSPDSVEWPDGVDREKILGISTGRGLPYMLLTRPMTFAASGTSRRQATPRGVESLRIQGLPDCDSLAVWYGSHDGVHWEALRVFDPHTTTLLLTPVRLWHRLLLMTGEIFGGCLVVGF